MSSDARQAYRVELVPERGMSHDEGVRALHAFLKCSLRSYGLRCTSVEPITTAQDEPQQATETQPGE